MYSYFHESFVNPSVNLEQLIRIKKCITRPYIPEIINKKESLNSVTLKWHLNNM